MAHARAGAGRARGTQAPLTRRQQKRARQKSAAAPATAARRPQRTAPRRVSAPLPPRAATAAVAVSAPPLVVAHPAAVVAVPERDAVPAIPPQAAAVALAALPNPTPRDADECADCEPLSESAAEAAAALDAPPRKFATLATMVAVAERGTADDADAADTEPAGAVEDDKGTPDVALDTLDTHALEATFDDASSAPVMEPTLPARAALDSDTPETADGSFPDVDFSPPAYQPARPAMRRRLPRPQPVPNADPVLPLAGVQTAVAVAGALSGAVLLLAGNPAGWWPLALAIISGIGGWLAYALTRHPQRASRALLASQLAVLAWALALLGPRAALLVLVPALAMLALRLLGSAAAVAVVALAFALYAVCAALVVAGVLRPAVSLDLLSSAVLDGALSCLGLALALRAALGMYAARKRAEAIATARRYDQGIIHGRSAALRHQVEDDVERLRETLRAAHTGRVPHQVTSSGLLGPLAEEVDITAARMHTLLRDRDERRRLESAISRLARALERAWLGLPWDWPDPSDSALDDVVSLLRSPNPRETAKARLDDTSGLLPIPTLDTASAPPWAAPLPHPLAPLAEPHPLWTSGELRVMHLDSAQATANQGPLPWEDWDHWRGWDGSQDSE
ncbi:MAG: hypothetical protein ACHQ4H_12400 [Ktedonobacterales bacterium]